MALVIISEDLRTPLRQRPRRPQGGSLRGLPLKPNQLLHACALTARQKLKYITH